MSADYQITPEEISDIRDHIAKPFSDPIDNGTVLWILRNLESSRAEVLDLRKDMEDAAGELLVGIPEPGSVASKMLMANNLMRRERDKARAEVQRLTEESRRLREIEVSEECYGMLAAHGSDGTMLVCGEFKSGREFKEKYRVARRSDAGRVEVPELTEAVMHNIQHLWPEDDARQAKEITDWFRFNARSRLSPSPQPSADVVVENDYVAWLRWNGHTFVTCNSNSEGAFRVWRKPSAPDSTAAECEWHPGDIPGTGVRGWKTSCGESMYPKHRWRIGEDGINFCPNCGKRAVQVTDDEWAARSSTNHDSKEA